MKFMQKQPGFTLIEVIVALLIFGILAIMITPAFTQYVTQYRLTSAAEGYYDDVNLARSRAIEQTTGVVLSIQTGSSWCYGLTVNTNCNCNSGANCELGRVTSADYPNTSLSVDSGFLTQSSPTSKTTTFDNTRGVPSAIGTITISATGAGQSLTVSIGTLGTPKICSASATVGGYPAC